MSGETAALDRVPRWGMVVDLNRCVGCQTCTVACKHANDTAPGVQWRRVLDIELGRFPDVERFFLLVGCQHCDDPPCVPVCPTGATARRADGIVLQDYDLCIGCGYCAVSCPYQARSIVHRRVAAFGGSPHRQEAATDRPERLGVAQKCTFCVGRIDAGLARGLVPGVDPDATPACAAACIASAIAFGDMNDPKSAVARLVVDKPSIMLNDALGTRPFIRYLYETPAHPGRDIGLSGDDDERLAKRGSPLVGQPQVRWDFRAAMNFGLGGAGSGLAFVATLALGAGRLDPAAVMLAHFIGACFMAVGLIFVFFEIGRQERFLNALRRPQTSWMSREIYVVGVFYAAVAAEFLFPMPWLQGAAGALAFAFLYCQARILNAAKGIPAWRAPVMRPMLVTTGLAEGAGLLALLNGTALNDSSLIVPLAAALAGLLILLAGLWLAFRGTAASEGIPFGARRDIETATPILLGVGVALPILLAAFAVLASGLASAALLGIAGASAVAGGLFWKFVVITEACHTQGFAIAKVPQRGSGALAAPNAVGP